MTSLSAPPPATFGSLEPSFPTSLDSTMIAAFTACPQKFFIEYCLKLAPSGISPDLHAGGALAAGMETTRLAFYKDKDPLEVAVGKGFIALSDYWGDYVPPEKHPKDFITTAYALTEYFNHWNPETDVLQPYFNDEGHPAVEFTFALPLPVNNPVTGDPIFYSGRCDLVGTYNSIPVICDEKTSKSLGPSWKRKWGMRGQFYGYAYVANEHGYNIENALVRAISLQKTQTVLEETLVPLPKWRQERWFEATLSKIEQIIRQWKHMEELVHGLSAQQAADTLSHSPSEWDKIKANSRHLLWPYAFSEACESYSGCAFASLCKSQHPANWYDDYDRRVWDPLAKDPTEGNASSLESIPSLTLPSGEMERLGLK